MRLKIVKELKDSEFKENYEPDVKVIDYKTFNLKDVHPFIASNKWESIDIILEEGLVSNYIRQILLKDNIVNLYINENIDINPKIIQTIIEARPKVAPNLRKAFSQRKTKEEICEIGGVTII